MTILDSRCYSGTIAVRNINAAEWWDQTWQMARASRINRHPPLPSLRRRIDATAAILEYERERAIRRHRTRILNP